MLVPPAADAGNDVVVAYLDAVYARVAAEEWIRLVFVPEAQARMLALTIALRGISPVDEEGAAALVVAHGCEEPHRWRKEKQAFKFQPYQSAALKPLKSAVTQMMDADTALWAVLWPIFANAPGAGQLPWHADDVVAETDGQYALLVAADAIVNLCAFVPSVLTRLGRAPSQPYLDYDPCNALFGFARATLKDAFHGSTPSARIAKARAPLLTQYIKLTESLVIGARAKAYHGSSTRAPPASALMACLGDVLELHASMVLEATLCCKGPCAHHFRVSAAVGVYAVDPDETDALASVVAQYESELVVDVLADDGRSTRCADGHPLFLLERLYNARNTTTHGPRELLVFAGENVLRASLSPTLVLTEQLADGTAHAHPYRLLLVLSQRDGMPRTELWHPDGRDDEEEVAEAENWAVTHALYVRKDACMWPNETAFKARVEAAECGEVLNLEEKEEEEEESDESDSSFEGGDGT